MRIKYYVVRVYVGPVHVQHYAMQARTAGMVDITEGTEHVIGVMPSPELTTEGDRQCFRQAVCDAVYAAPMAGGWRDVEILRAK